jgi:uncharacterized membrane protein
MRSKLDRLRHTLLFELLALLIVTPLVVWMTAKPLMSVASLSFTLSIIAMFLNYGFNYLFDIAEIKIKGKRNRTLKTRLLHVSLFELVMLICTIPIIAWWLDMSYWQAFIMDLVFIVFFMCYAFTFNWLYDVIFPLPEFVPIHKDA